MTENRLFEDNVDYITTDTRFDGAFLADSSNHRIRVDDTQHCVCALMKLDSYLYLDIGQSDISYSYTEENISSADSNSDNFGGYDYDLFISLSSIPIVIILAICIFFYWCYWYPKKRTRENDLFYLAGTISSDIKSDKNKQFADLNQEDVISPQLSYKL